MLRASSGKCAHGSPALSGRLWLRSASSADCRGRVSNPSYPLLKWIFEPPPTSGQVSQIVFGSHIGSSRSRAIRFSLLQNASRMDFFSWKCWQFYTFAHPKISSVANSVWIVHRELQESSDTLFVSPEYKPYGFFFRKMLTVLHFRTPENPNFWEYYTFFWFFRLQLIKIKENQ